ncbi:hypothetical protein ALON55S_02474 [Alishewanella longhuensis]
MVSNIPEVFCRTITKTYDEAELAKDDRTICHLDYSCLKVATSFQTMLLRANHADGIQMYLTM